MNPTSRWRAHGDGGAAAVEFALVLPILVALLFGIVEFGFAFNTQISMTQAAREGVRVVALNLEDAGGNPISGVDATQDAFYAVAADMSRFSATVVDNCVDADPSDRARVSATYQYEPMLGAFLPAGPWELSTEAVMRCGG